ncbi:MAG: AraC family transcriptional regulator, partial [Eubacteriales bacterium]
FMPWENNFTRGLYLAGAECNDGAEAPDGWTKWVIPAYTYLRVPCGADAVFEKTLAYIRENGYVLAGAVHDFTDPAAGMNYMYFPIERG